MQIYFSKFSTCLYYRCCFLAFSINTSPSMVSSCLVLLSEIDYQLRFYTTCGWIDGGDRLETLETTIKCFSILTNLSEQRHHEKAAITQVWKCCIRVCVQTLKLKQFSNSTLLLQQITNKIAQNFVLKSFSILNFAALFLHCGGGV